MKEQDNTPEKELNDVEISNLPDKELNGNDHKDVQRTWEKSG